jgi:hypothetical protein
MPLENQIIRALVLLLLLLPATASGQQSPGLGQPYSGNEFSGPMTKQQLLQSSRWRQVERKFDEWLSVQRIYDAAQVAQMKSKFKQRVTAMSADQLEDFIAVAEEKLQVLLGDEATQARSYMSFYTDNFLKKKMGDKPPNIGTMSPTQMRQELSEFQQRRAGRATAQQEFNRLQTDNVKAMMQRQNQMQAQRQAVRQPRPYDSYYGHPYAYGGGPYARRSPYAPQPYVAPRPQFSISPWGGVWRTLP